MNVNKNPKNLYRDIEASTYLGHLRDHFLLVVGGTRPAPALGRNPSTSVGRATLKRPPDVPRHGDTPK